MPDQPDNEPVYLTLIDLCKSPDATPAQVQEFILNAVHPAWQHLILERWFYKASMAQLQLIVKHALSLED